jgi:hypothetical protein
MVHFYDAAVANAVYRSPPAPQIKQSTTTTTTTTTTTPDGRKEEE